MTEPVTTKILKLDLDPGASISSSNKKDKKGKKKPAPQASTSIIDSILKMKNSVEPANKPSPAPANKKKLIIDMSNDSHIIAEEKPASQDPPGPAIKPLFAPVREKPLPTLTLKSEERKRGKTPELNPESSTKLNTMLMLDNLFPSKNPESVNSVRDLNPPPYPEPGISIDKTAVNSDKPVATVPIILDNLRLDGTSSKYTDTGLAEINAQIKQVRAKLTKKPDDPKYTDMLAKLEAKQAKYMKKLAKTSAKNPDLQATADIKQIPESILTEIDYELNKTHALLDKMDMQNNALPAQPPKYANGREAGISAVFAVPNELASMKERKLHLLAEQKKLSDKLVHRHKQIDRIKNWQREVEKLTELQKEKQKIFDLQRELKKLEKQQYLQDQHLKQQLYTIKKQTHEKSLELKRLDVREYKAIREAGLNLLKTPAPHPNPPKPAQIAKHITTVANSKPSFLSQLTSSSFFNNLGKIKIGERVFFNKPPFFSGEASQNGKNGSSGREFRGTGVSQVLTPETVVDKKTGLEFFTAETVSESNTVDLVANDEANITPVPADSSSTGINAVPADSSPGINAVPADSSPGITPVPADSSSTGINPVPADSSIELTDDEILEKAKLMTRNNSQVIGSIENPSIISHNESQVSKEIMSSKFGLLSGDTGLDKILTLATNGITSKTEKQGRNACLLNMYKDITDAGILVC